MNKKFLVLRVLLLVFTVVLPVNADDKISLSLMHYHTEESRDADALAFREMLEKFSEENPDIEVNVELLDIDSYFMKLQTLAAANELPDIFLLKSSLVDTFARGGLIEPLNAELNQDGWKDGFVDGAFADFLKGENIYAIPYAMGATSLIYYNKEIFDEAGIADFPENWTEFKTVIRKLKEAGYIPIALGNKGKWVVNSCIIGTLADRFTGTDWFYSILNNEGASFTDQKFVDALAALQELAEIAAFNPDMNSIDANQQKSLYYNRDAAMFIEGHWAINSIMEQASEDIVEATRISIIPAVPGGKGVQKATSAGSGMGYQLNPALQGAKREAALKFIKTVTGEEYSNLLIEKNGTPVFKTGNYDKSKIARLKVDYINLTEEITFTPVYDLHLAPSIIEVMNSGMQELLLRITTAEELAERIQHEYEILNR
ncbi:MAG: extracellular solute-binding protein [Firmicutes bacterium]|nr:extracellular solute-binding protein [Bacillota bacterium]